VRFDRGITPVAMKMTTNPNRLPFRDYALRQGVRPLLANC
jgi:hypothetical protein